MMRGRATSGESRAGRLFGFASIGALTGIVVFLLVFPTVEREAHLNQIRGDDSESWPGALLHLCWTRPGVAGIEGALEESDLDHRRQLLQAISDAGCLEELAPRFRARHEFETGDVDAFIGYGEDHVEIALQAVESEDVERVRHADRALAALWPDLEDAYRSKIRAVVEERPNAHVPRLADLLDQEGSDGETRQQVDETHLETMVDAVVGAEHAVRETRALAEALASIDTLPEPDMDLRLPEPSLRAPTRGGPLFSKGEGEESGAASQPDDSEKP